MKTNYIKFTFIFVFSAALLGSSIAWAENDYPPVMPVFSDSSEPAQPTSGTDTYATTKPSVQSCGQAYDSCRSDCGVECVEICARQLKDCLDGTLGPAKDLEHPDLIPESDMWKFDF